MRLALALAAATMATPAFADEVWSSDYGPIAWETDVGETAVLLLTEDGTGRVVRLLVDGLALDVNGGRGAYRGVWIANSGETPCVADMIDPVSGAKSPHWGTFSITFVTHAFPSDFAGIFGQCLDTPWDPIAGVAVTG